jgi:hypothetical protein
MEAVALKRGKTPCLGILGEQNQQIAILFAVLEARRNQ